MTGFKEKDGVLHADNISLTEIAEIYGTPVYVYSAERLRENVTRLQTAMKNGLPEDRQPIIAYACKANSNQAVLTVLRTMGLGCDVVSGGEIKRAVAAGMDTNKIVYSGVGKSDEEIALAIDTGIRQINVESRSELERIADIAKAKNKTAPVTFRLNPDVEADTHDKISTGRSEDKFGIARADIEELYPWAHQHEHLSPQGLHMHIGSQISDMKPFRESYQKLADFADLIKSKGLPLDTLDIGGGLGIIYDDEKAPDLDEYAAIINELIVPLDTAIILEPGRFISGDAGVLLAKTSYIKESETRRFVVLDAGMNDLIRPTLYDAYHAIQPVHSNSGDKLDYDIVGPVCETGDTFQRGVSLPEVQKDDLIAIMCAGAYGFVMASNYNTRAFPAEVIVDGDKHSLIRAKQTIQDIINKDTIPDWL